MNLELRIENTNSEWQEHKAKTQFHIRNSKAER